MSAGFTPGPWEVGPVDDTIVTRLAKDGQRYEVAAVDGDYNEPDMWPVMEANARLIAAAPDLYDALTALVSEYGTLGGKPYDHSPEHPITRARAALAKAAGK